MANHYLLQIPWFLRGGGLTYLLLPSSAPSATCSPSSHCLYRLPICSCYGLFLHCRHHPQAVGLLPGASQCLCHEPAYQLGVRHIRRCSGQLWEGKPSPLPLCMRPPTSWVVLICAEASQRWLLLLHMHPLSGREARATAQNANQPSSSFFFLV